MKKENRYDFRKKLLIVHEPNRRNTQLSPNSDELELKNGLTLFVGAVDIVTETAANDFVNYLSVSMNVSSSIVTDEENANICLYLAADKGVELVKGNGYKGFRIDVTEDKVKIYGYDFRGIAQALYYLEDVMNMRTAPFIPKETVELKPLFAPRMTNSGYGYHDYPDEHLSRMAHEGFDAITVYTKGVNMTIEGPLDFNELIDRCEKYGIDVYMYSCIPIRVHPSDPDAEEFFDSTFGEIFKACPRLKGLFLVGESLGFPSKDPHLVRDKYTPKHIPSFNLGSGGYPCCDYPELISAIKKAVNKYNDSAKIVFSTYNWGYQDDEARIKLINSLPEGTALSATFEMFDEVKTGGHISDYTISFEGPGHYFKTEAAAAYKKGIELYSITNTGGLTWDMGTIPYVPVPYQWIKRYKEMRKANANWNLTGITENIHYGWYPSFISKLAKWSFWNNDVDFEEVLAKIVASEFGAKNTDKVLEALKYLSEAFTYSVPSAENQYGSFRVGTAYPLALACTYRIPIDPDNPRGAIYCHTEHDRGCDFRMTILNARIGKEIKSLEKMLSIAKKATLIFNELEGDNEKLDNLINLCRYIECVIISGINFKKWYVLKNKFFDTSNPKKLSKILDTLEKMLYEEKENARRSLEYVDNDSRLGWEPQQRYVGSRENIEWKMEVLDRVVQLEFGDYRSGIAIAMKKRKK